jgi:hypothetical protein
MDMPSYLISSFVIAVLLVSACADKKKNPEVFIDRIAADSDSLQGANLEFIEDFFDFGTIAQGEIVSHTFRFRNSGSSPLIVRDIIPSCGCTKSKIEKPTLKPGEESKIEVIFDSSGWRGLQYKSITLRTNSPIREKSVTIKANVVVKN